jgi:hypothetical protein
MDIHDSLNMSGFVAARGNKTFITDMKASL